MDIACQHHANLGYSQNLVMLKNIHQHIQIHAGKVCYLGLKTMTKPIIHKIQKTLI